MIVFCGFDVDEHLWFDAETSHGGLVAAFSFLDFVVCVKNTRHV